MDQERFDEVARGLASGISRRGMVRYLTGAAFGGVLVAVGESAAGARKKRGRGKHKERPRGRTRSAAAGKVAVCHYDADAETWVLITVSKSGWDNGHSSHGQDYLLDGNCCTDGDCAGDGSCCDGVCTDSPTCNQCTTCGDGCPGDPENNPTVSVSFAPTGDPRFCSPTVHLTGFHGCTDYTYQYWGSFYSDGYIADNFGMNHPLTRTDLSGSSETLAGTFNNGAGDGFPRYVEFRINGGPVSGWQRVSC